MPSCTWIFGLGYERYVGRCVFSFFCLWNIILFLFLFSLGMPFKTWILAWIMKGKLGFGRIFHVTLSFNAPFFSLGHVIWKGEFYFISFLKIELFKIMSFRV